jgi:integrase
VVSLGFNADGKRVRKKVSGKTKAEVRDKLKEVHSELDAGVRTVHGYTVEKAVADWLAEGLPDAGCAPRGGPRSRPSERLGARGYAAGTDRAAVAVADPRLGRRAARGGGAVAAARVHRAVPADRAVDQWQEHGLVFTTSVGTPFESHNLRPEFRKVTAAAGLGARWVPKELRTSFVSMMSYHGVPVEEIARLAGHASSRTTEVIYRRELRPVITTGAEVMDQIFRPRQAEAT